MDPEELATGIDNTLVDVFDILHDNHYTCEAYALALLQMKNYLLELRDRC